MLDLGWCDAGEEVRLSQSGEIRNERKRLKLAAYRLSVPALEETIRCLAQSTLTIGEVTGRSLSGQVSAQRAGLLVTSIPGEDGWQASVDGRKVPVRLFGGAMLSVDVPAGVHAVAFIYTPPGRTPGIWLSLVCAAILILLYVFSRGYHRR